LKSSGPIVVEDSFMKRLSSIKSRFLEIWNIINIYCSNSLGSFSGVNRIWVGIFIIYLVHGFFVNHAHSGEFGHWHGFHQTNTLERPILDRITLLEPSLLRHVVTKDVFA
jgi:hypothetical protein